ncbi:MAG: hypothetical protein JO023_01850 [Chloroflexi bacterium]|nr:hypothetical protein [Chloroflexota bacterium]
MGTGIDAGRGRARADDDRSTERLLGQPGRAVSGGDCIPPEPWRLLLLNAPSGSRGQGMDTPIDKEADAA